MPGDGEGTTVPTGGPDALPSMPVSPDSAVSRPAVTAFDPDTVDDRPEPLPPEARREQTEGPGLVPRSDGPGDDNGAVGLQADSPEAEGPEADASPPRSLAGGPTGRTTEMLGDP